VPPRTPKATDSRGGDPQKEGFTSYNDNCPLLVGLKPDQPIRRGEAQVTHAPPNVGHESVVPARVN